MKLPRPMDLTAADITIELPRQAENSSRWAMCAAAIPSGRYLCSSRASFCRATRSVDRLVGCGAVERGASLLRRAGVLALRCAHMIGSRWVQTPRHGDPIRRLTCRRRRRAPFLLLHHPPHLSWLGWADRLLTDSWHPGLCVCGRSQAGEWVRRPGRPGAAPRLPPRRALQVRSSRGAPRGAGSTVRAPLQTTN